jgi:NAD(P)-dependent dehydrogenase (short-subunit alcohol dehydrogenase family)
VHYATNQNAANEVVATIEHAGGQAFTVQAALNTPDGAAQLWAEFARHADGLDILVNNAGMLGTPSPFPAVSEKTYDDVFALNTRAVFFVTQAGLPMLRDNGRIINLSTVLTHGTRIPEVLPYAMSKGAIDVFTSTLAKGLGSRGITVNAVGPGVINTDMNAQMLSTAEGQSDAASLSPFGRVAQPDDVADVVAFLASHDARWVTGQWIDVSGGATL